jgi:glucan phosphoethanolaminetransferase (alkaline phosphatase superfamily)
MSIWKQLIVSFAVAIGVGMVAAPVGAVEVFEGCDQNPGAAVCQSRDDDAADMIKTAINAALMVLGMIAVLMIVIGGIRYTTSNGESAKVKSAKDTVMYSVIGLVVAILSYTIVNFVIGRF